MSVPTPKEDGFRYYAQWGGNPRGTREDVTRCVEQVHDGGRGMRLHQCNRKRGHGPDGLYCKQHDPAAVAARRQEAADRWHAKRDRAIRPMREADAYRTALRQIANGHNDPSALAREVLHKFEKQ
jgi:hypothetical protein